MLHLKHKMLWITVGSVLTALGVMGIMFFAFAAGGESLDYTGIAAIVVAVGVIIGQVLTWHTAKSAAQKATDAEKQAIVTHQAVNSRMDEFKKLFEETFRLKGAEEEREKMAAAEAPAAEAPAAILAAAELKAQALIAEASRQASRLLAEAHKVSITNLSANPVPVQVVGPGVDTALRVTDDGAKK